MVIGAARQVEEIMFGYFPPESELSGIRDRSRRRLKRSRYRKRAARRRRPAGRDESAA